jgi:iron-sulfur cluster repair protein YtfE (RIC family)
MSTSTEFYSTVRQAVETLLIRDLLERYPALLPVLDAHGLDLCCGGGHTVAEAAALHGLDLEAVLVELDAAVATARAR